MHEKARIAHFRGIRQQKQKRLLHPGRFASDVSILIGTVWLVRLQPWVHVGKWMGTPLEIINDGTGDSRLTRFTKSGGVSVLSVYHRVTAKEL